MPKSRVFFVPVEKSKDNTAVAASFKQLIKQSRFCDNIKKNELVPIKIHMGEKANTGHVKPEVLKPLINQLKARAGKPFIVETNVLYQGSRVNAVDHLMLAAEHGFEAGILGAPVFIADGLWGENSFEVTVDQKHFKKVHIAKPVKYFDTIISIAHVTGHLLTGFAASIKNMGMGLASRTGKLRQHSNIKPKVISKNCTLCKRCLEQCPVQAIIEKDKKAFIQQEVCVGCGECIAACKFAAISDSYGEDAKILSEKMAEYAYGVLKNINNKVFFNFAIRITKNCDCMAKDEPSIVDDIGIFASDDPVACDRAAAQAVVEKAGTDIFKKGYPSADFYMNQLNYAEQIGLGSNEYELVIIK
jgi:uncharacterized Fe-S center protein